MTEEGPEVITTHLVGGPAHGEKLTISTAFTTVQVVKGNMRLEYWQQRFLSRGEIYALFVWPGLSPEEVEKLAWKEICGS